MHEWHARRLTLSTLTTLMLLAAGGCGEPSHAPVDGVARQQAPASAPATDAASDRGPDGSWSPWFEEVAEERGLRFRHQSGHHGPFLMPEIMCGGAALFDADGDGDLDAYLVQAGRLTGPKAAHRPPNQLFRNDGRGFFEDVTAASGSGDRGYGMGAACGDVDRDGDVDLYVTNWGPNVLLANDGTGRFHDDTERAGVGDPSWGSSAAFCDLDADGHLDLYVANYLSWTVEGELSCRNFRGRRDYCNPASYQAPARDVLYRNQGDGRFLDETEASGVGALAATGLGVVCADFDADGRLDIFVANDGMPNLLWHNEGGFRFRDEALSSGCSLDHSGQAKAGMGVVAGDVDDDGDQDLLVCNLDQQTDSLFLNQGGSFADGTARSGLGAASKPLTRFGVGWIDFDHDGWLDLFEAAGRVSEGTTRWREDDPYAEPNLVLRGTGPGRFERLPTADGTAAPAAATSRAAAFGDVDGDGGVDVLVVNRDGPAHLLRNVVAPREGGRWVILRVVDEAGRDALGARITLRVGNRTRVVEVRAASSYQASNDPGAHVGLGSERGVLDIRVRWVDGVEERFGDLAAGARHLLRRGAGLR